MRISITFDVEPDLHTGNYLGITRGLYSILDILNKYDIKATFFATCDCIEKYPEIFKNLKQQGHEIVLHAYRHERFDELSLEEKKNQIGKSINCFKKNLKQHPTGFRTPQHSIDNSTLDMLDRYSFKYDSSYTPLNLLQLFFFPKKFKLWIKHFFSPRKIYKIRKNLYEIPPTSFFIPFVSLILRIFPKELVILYLNTLRVFNKNLVFYAHSWDFIDIPESRIARKFPKEKLIKNLDFLLGFIKKGDKYKFCRLIDLIR